MSVNAYYDLHCTRKMTGSNLDIDSPWRSLFPSIKSVLIRHVKELISDLDFCSS